MTIKRRTLLGGMLLAPAVGAVCGRAAAAQSAGNGDGEWRDYDAWLRGQAGAGGFAGSVLVARGERVLLRRGYGLADRARQVANTARTRFCVASMGKMFTGVAVAQLVGRGRLAFTDTVGAHLPGFPPEIADRITVDQLPTHTAGMGDVLRRTPDGPPPPVTLAEQLRRIAAEPLLFEPGTRFGYSNSGFIVLGGIIERVTGRRYPDYVRDHVFRPAGMVDTAIRVYRAADVPGMAHGYNGATGADTSEDLQIGNPSGGAYSTVVDMYRFARALTRHRLLSPALTDTVVTGRVATGRPGPGEDRYGYGFGDQRLNGVRIVGHNGGNPGYEGELDIYLGKGYSVVILMNQDGLLQPALRRSQDLLSG
jgi:CubicO group peptidase (beta-lactamase class C family)